ncbi:MAG TPA: hypothetical protein VNB94_03925 [Mycobacteriales bacterium]|nr:hypothetical protein [Mycobacteriales bacterium]
MRRTVLAAAIAVIALAAPHAGAAPKPQLTDPRGDYPVAGADIVSALFVTEKKTKLVVTVEFAGPPNTPVPFAYQLRFSTDDNCTWRGNVFGVDGSSSGGCTGSNASPPAVKISGNKIVFTMPAKGALKPGTELSDIAVSSTPGGALAGAPGGDTAATDAAYVVGS